MRIAIASGKGGTGKTTVAVNLAVTAGSDVRLLDCDVEEPNDHIFLSPEFEATETVTVPVPEVDAERCTQCGECARACQFNAIVSLKSEPLVFPELCHGCGACAMVCPADAIGETEREVGTVERGRANGVAFAHGSLRVGEAMSPPLIRAVKRADGDEALTIIDAPPGTSCPVIEAVRHVDAVLLVTEPTPFGLNDLKLAVDMVRALGLPFTVAINRADVGDDGVERFCRDEGIAVLARIPDDRRIAECYSRGGIVVTDLPEMRPVFEEILEGLKGVTA